MVHPPNWVNLSLQVVPVNTQDAYPIIDAAIEAIRGTGVRYEITPFATIMEGPWEQLMEAVEEAREAALKAGAEEVLLNLQIHLKKGKDVRFEDKVAR